VFAPKCISRPMSRPRVIALSSKATYNKWRMTHCSTSGPKGTKPRFEGLMSLVYDDMRRLAKRYMANNVRPHLAKPPRWSSRPTAAPRLDVSRLAEPEYFGCVYAHDALHPGGRASARATPRYIFKREASSRFALANFERSTIYQKLLTMAHFQRILPTTSSCPG
jgi:hypothetical protein